MARGTSLKQSQGPIFFFRRPHPVTDRAIHSALPGGRHVYTTMNGVELFRGGTLCPGFRKSLGLPDRGVQSGPLPDAMHHGVTMSDRVRRAEHRARAMSFLYGRRICVAIEADAVVHQTGARIRATMLHMAARAVHVRPGVRG